VAEPFTAACARCAGRARRGISLRFSLFDIQQLGDHTFNHISRLAAVPAYWSRRLWHIQTINAESIR